MLFSLLALLPVALSAPAIAPDHLSSLSKFTSALTTQCSAAKVAVPLPANASFASVLSTSAGEKTEIITVGRGVQNYTCTAGKYVSAGALAK